MTIDEPNQWTDQGERPRDLVRGRDLTPGLIRGEVYEENEWDVERQDGSGGIAFYLRILTKYWWAILGCFIACVSIGVAATLLTTPIFRAQTTLQIDREAANIVGVSSVEPREQAMIGDEFFQTQYGLLRSRSLAARVVDSLRLAGDDKFLTRMGAKPDFSNTSPAQVADARRQAAISLFQGNLDVMPVRGSRLVKVTFDSPDPALSAVVANAAADNFIASNLDRRFESSAYARKFLEERLAQTKTKLEESERALVAYAASQQIINVQQPTEKGSSGGTQSLTSSSLVALNAAFATARGERIRAEERWRRAESAPLLTLPEVLENRTVQELSQERAKLLADYQEKLSDMKPAHPQMQLLQARISEIDRQIQAVGRDVQSSMKTQYEVALSQERSFEGQVNQLKGAVLNLRDRTIQYDILQREVDTNRTLYEGLLQRYKEIGVAGGITTDNVSIVDRAEIPTSPSKPRLILNLLASAAIGLLLGVVLAFVMELLDDSITTPNDVRDKLGLALIGTSPKLRRGATPLEALQDVRSAFSEAYYSIRTTLQFSTLTGAPKTLLVTSSRQAEGKSTTAYAIARGFAQIGLKTLLIDCDLRNPSMHRNLGADNSRGFSNVLTGSATIQEVVQNTDVADLFLIPCGPLPPNPAELLGGNRVSGILNTALETYDMVVVDGPPVMGLADAPLLATATVGTLFVVEARGTRKGPARLALKRLRLGRSTLIGVVLTKFEAKRVAYGDNYAYAYDYAYGSANLPQRPAG